MSEKQPTHIITDPHGSVYEAINATNVGGNFYPILAENYRLIRSHDGNPYEGQWMGEGAWSDQCKVEAV